MSKAALAEKSASTKTVNETASKADSPLKDGTVKTGSIKASKTSAKAEAAKPLTLSELIRGKLELGGQRYGICRCGVDRDTFAEVDASCRHQRGLFCTAACDLATPGRAGRRRVIMRIFDCRPGGHPAVPVHRQNSLGYPRPIVLPYRPAGHLRALLVLR